MSREEKVKSFCDKYFVSIIDKSRRFLRHRPSEYFSYAHDKELYQNPLEVESEPLLTVTIPLSKLEAIAEIEGLFFNNIEDVYSRRIFETWMDSQAEEKHLRQKYPTVQAAYEQYSMTLHLCREKPNKFKTLD